LPTSATISSAPTGRWCDCGRPTALCTIYEPRYPDPRVQRLAVTGLALFNDVITRAAFAHGLPVLDLRLICDNDADFANPIEPSAQGGDKIAAVFVYVAGLLAMLGFSAAYNMWPVSPTKWLLRRFDHSAIYVMIAGTYTPLLLQMQASVATVALLAGVWATALVGAALKLAFPGRLDRISIALYLALGWSVLAAYDSVLPALPSSALVLLALGGLLYSGGVIFHVWSRLRFQNAIWHAFVLAAAACHWGAIVDCIVLARA